MSSQDQNHYFWISGLRVLASFGVVLLHTSASMLEKYGEISDHDWWVSNFSSNFLRCWIPIFLMITGALILPKVYGSTKEFLGKRVVRIVYPFLFWSLIYLAKQSFLMLRNGELHSIVDVVKFSVLEMKSGAMYHLWYIYVLIGVYLFLPILGKWVKNSSLNEVKYFIVIWAITIIAALPYVDLLFPNVELRYFSGYIGFTVLGYYFMKTEYQNTRLVKWISVLLILLGTFITVFGTYYFTDQQGSLFKLFYQNMGPNVIITAIGLFLLFKYLNFDRNRNKTLTTIVMFFSRYSYGIYLAHILVLSALSIVGLNNSFINPLFAIPITAISCYVLSALLVWGLNKLPFGKYFAG